MVVAPVTVTPTVAISPDSLMIPCGGHVVFQGVTWEQFEAIAWLTDKSSLRGIAVEPNLKL